MLFRVLFIKEHDESNKIDTQMFILYDHTESNYFYYGTRRQYKHFDPMLYNGYYHCDRIDSLNNFLENVLDKYNELITYEMHNLQIDESEYSMLNFEYIKMKVNINTEIFAYDKKKINMNDMYYLLDSLVPHSV